MEILVTGGGGFLGRYIVEALVKEGHSVSILGRSEQPELASKGIRLYQGDLQDPAFVEEACKNKEAVFHVAAKAGVWGSRQSYIDANVLGTRNILKASKQAGVRYLIYTSTPSVVFNRQSFRGDNESLPYGKDWLCHYAETKAIAEKESLEADSSAISVCALRPHLIFGPRDHHLLPRVIKAVLSGRLKIVGKGKNLVDVTYVKDAALAHVKALAALQSGKACGKAYFISQGSPVVLWEWLNRILSELNIPEIKQKLALPLAYGIGGVFEFIYKILNLKGEPPMTRFVAVELAKDHYFDLSNARRDLDFNPQYSMDQAIKETVEDLAQFSNN